MLLSKLRYNPVYFSLIITAAILAAVTFFQVRGYQDPSGGDGYFYLKQAQWLKSHLQFYHADYSFVFLPLAALTWITESPLLAYQILTCLNLFVILSAFSYFVMRGLKSLPKLHVFLLSQLIIVLLSFQTPLLRLGFEFVKNGFAIALLLAGFVLLFENKKWAALLFIFLAAMTHKTLAIFMLISVIGFFFQLGENNNKRKIIYTGIALTGATMLAIIFHLLNPRLNRHFGSFLSEIDFESYKSIFNFNLHLNWPHMLLIVVWLFIFLSHGKNFWLSVGKDRWKKSIVLSLIIFSILPLLPIFGGANAEIKWRLMIFSFTFSFILCTLVTTILFDRKAVSLIALVTVLLLSHELFVGNNFPWIARTSQQVPAVSKLTEYVKPGEELITHHGMQFYVDFKTPIRAKSLLDQAKLPLWQLAYVAPFFLSNPRVADAIEQIRVSQIGPSYGLFYYEDFQNLLKEFPFLLNWKNTYRLRPGFIQSYGPNAVEPEKEKGINR